MSRTFLCWEGRPTRFRVVLAPMSLWWGPMGVPVDCGLDRGTAVRLMREADGSITGKVDIKIPEHLHPVVCIDRTETDFDPETGVVTVKKACLRSVIFGVNNQWGVADE